MVLQPRRRGEKSFITSWRWEVVGSTTTCGIKSFIKEKEVYEEGKEEGRKRERGEKEEEEQKERKQKGRDSLLLKGCCEGRERGAGGPE